VRATGDARRDVIVNEKHGRECYEIFAFTGCAPQAANIHPRAFHYHRAKKSLRKKRDRATLMIEIEKRESDSEKDHSSLNIADESRRFVNENLEFACPPVV